MGIYRGQVVHRPLKNEQNFGISNYRFFNLMETYKTIDNLDDNEATNQGYIKAWALKSGKYAIATHQILINNCFQEKFVQTILKDVNITPIQKKKLFSSN